MNRKLKIFLKYLSKHKPQAILAIGIILYVVYFTLASFLRYDNFYTGRYDLGNMDQVVWNTSHGRFFQASSDTGETVSRLSSHADVILILFGPLYKLWADPRLLLLIQVLVLAAGAVFIYKISNLILKNNKAATVFSLLYLLNPLVEYTNLYDFHSVTLATTFLLATFYFFLKKKYWLFILFSLLAVSTKEETWIIIGFFGIFTLIKQILKLLKKKEKIKNSIKPLLLSSALIIFCFTMFYLLISVIIPGFRGGEHFALNYYSDFGTSPIDIIKNIIFSPGKVISTMIDRERLSYVFYLFAPLGFTSILSPVTLFFIVPEFGINLLSNNSNLHQIYYQYSANLTPFIFISSIFGIHNLLKWFPKIKLNHLLIFITMTSVFSAYFYGPLPGAKNPSVDMFTKQLADRDLIQAFISGIPTRYKIAATNNLGSHLSRRRNVYTIPEGLNSADMILFLLNDSFAQPSLNDQKQMVNILKTNPNYQLLFEQGEFIVFQKKSLNYKTDLISR